MNSITVIIPVKNAESQIEKCLSAVVNQSILPKEIILVDGYSTDKTVDIAKKYSVKIIYEDFGTVGGAREIGVENASNAYIAFTDADCIPDVDWLKNLLEEFGDNVIGVGGCTKNIGDGLWEVTISNVLDTFLGSAMSVQDRCHKKRHSVKSISGCNSIYRRSDIIKVGGFKTDYYINEDTDLNQRLLKFGKIVYTPDAIVFHDQKRNLLQFIRRMILFGYGRGKHKLWDFQVIPPFLALIVFFSAFFWFEFFIVMLLLYFGIVIFFSVIIFTKTKKLMLLFTTPIVFCIEHISYTFGFFKGLFSSKGRIQ